jgi:hypothetical protein
MGPGSGKVVRLSADLRAYPDLVVIYLGMRARSLRGALSILKIGPQIQASVKARPDGLLRHDGFLLGLFPLHVGMRQYWRDVDAMLAWTATLPHNKWWKNFLVSSSGTTFWHETYFASGGFESVYDDLPDGKRNFGLASFAPLAPAAPSTFARFRNAARAGRQESVNSSEEAP